MTASPSMGLPLSSTTWLMVKANEFQDTQHPSASFRNNSTSPLASPNSSFTTIRTSEYMPWLQTLTSGAPQKHAVVSIFYLPRTTLTIRGILEIHSNNHGHVQKKRCRRSFPVRKLYCLISTPTATNVAITSGLKYPELDSSTSTVLAATMYATTAIPNWSPGRNSSAIDSWWHG